MKRLCNDNGNYYYYDTNLAFLEITHFLYFSLSELHANMRLEHEIAIG